MANDQSPVASKRRRFSPEARRKMILEAAIELFAREGFDGSTHTLASHLGVTQPLIYKYFPSKEDLIEAVYEELFRGRWNDEWDAILADRTRPLADRLIDFYTRYCKIIHTPEWIRIFLYSGLKDTGINQRYTPIVEERAIRRICIEVRDSFDLPSLDTHPLTPEEMDVVWILHGGIFYHGVRRYVYRLPMETPLEGVIVAAVTTLLEGMPALVRRFDVDKA